MAHAYTSERIKSIISRDIAEIVRSELKNPKIGLVSVNEIDVNNDFSRATVYVTFLGVKYYFVHKDKAFWGDEKAQEVVNDLAEYIINGFVRSHLTSASADHYVDLFEFLHSKVGAKLSNESIALEDQMKVRAQRSL